MFGFKGSMKGSEKEPLQDGQVANDEFVSYPINSVHFSTLEELDEFFNNESSTRDDKLFAKFSVSKENLDWYDRRQSDSFELKHKTNLLICHDFKGGYIKFEDDSTNGYFPHPDSIHYNLRFPQLIDTFVYFSHEFITIPPVSWINYCHKNSIKCLGTIIIEGSNLNSIDKFDNLLKINSNDNNNDFIYDKLLTKLTEFFQFDGFLINFETNCSNNRISKKVIPFIESLKSNLHNSNNKNQLIWYDSYIYPQNVVYYQNGVNDLNFNFYNSSDSFLTNYFWNINNLSNNIKNIGLSGCSQKLFVGYDIFGRNVKIGNGGFDTSMVVKLIKKYKSNIGLFAPGWCYENFNRLEFNKIDSKFWLKGSSDDNNNDNNDSILNLISPHVSPVLKTSNEEFIFYTNFCTGEGKFFAINGLKIFNNNWINTNLQSDIPIEALNYNNTNTNNNNNNKRFNIKINNESSYLGGNCIKICYNELINNNNNDSIFNSSKSVFLKLFEINKECMYRVISIKCTFKLPNSIDDNKNIGIFQLKVSFHIDLKKINKTHKIRSGSFIIPLITYNNHSKDWITIEEIFSLPLRNQREILILNNINIEFIKFLNKSSNSNLDNFTSNTENCRSRIYEEELAPSIIDDEDYEKLIDSDIYDDDDYDGEWVLVPEPSTFPPIDDITGLPLESTNINQRSTNKLTKREILIGEILIANSNNYPPAPMNNNNNNTTTNNNNLNTKPLILNWKLKDKIKQESIIQLHPIVKNPFDLINSSKNYYNYFNIDPINEIESITVYDNFMIMNWNCCNSNELNENEFGVLFWCIFINDNFIGTSHSSCYAITHKNNVNNVNKFKFNLRIDCIDKLGCTISGRTISLKFSI
ncbi:hypothetical protein B5S31_g2130 [[Candida] boidinii]|nr:hypothetical protein B5S31_g2130 [[Candida] boidinii]